MRTNIYLQGVLKTFIKGFITIIFSCVVFHFAPVENAFAERLNNLSDLKQKPNLSKYLFSRAQQEDLTQIGIFWDKKLGLHQDCKEGREVISMSFMLLKPIDLPEDKVHPTTGVWQHRFAFKRCGEQKIYNAIFVAEKGERPKVIPYFPGTTSASGQLLRDALTSATMAAFVKFKKLENEERCHDIVLIDTQLKEPPHDVIEDGITIKGVWNEEWTLLGCGQTAKVAATFFQNDRGGTSFKFN